MTKRQRKPKPKTPAADKALEKFFRQDALLWLSHPNVVGVMLGRKLVDGARSDQPAIVFRVDRKLDDRSDVLAIGSKPIPKELVIGDRTYPTDVLEGGHSGDLDDGVYDPKQRYPFICPGISIGNFGVSDDAGTSTAIVRDRANNRLAVLSCDHVLRRRDGNGFASQPGRGDVATGNDIFGSPIRGIRNTTADAAIASIEKRPSQLRIPGLDIAITQIAMPNEGDLVVKAGRSTGISYGEVTSAQALMWVVYVDSGPKQVQGFEIRSKDGQGTQVGDSGAPWLLVDPATGKPTGTLLGIHTSSTPDGSDAFASYATSAFEALDIELAEAGDLADDEAAADDLVASPGIAGDAFRVTARRGLTLRAGAGLEFSKLELLPLDSIVHRISTDGQWMKVDLQGDGNADGFVYTPFRDQAPPGRRCAWGKPKRETAGPTLLPERRAAARDAFADVDTGEPWHAKGGSGAVNRRP